MIRPTSEELHDISTDLIESAAHLADVIDGDACGGLETEAARRELDMLRARFRSHGFAVLALSGKLETEEAQK